MKNKVYVPKSKFGRIDIKILRMIISGYDFISLCYFCGPAVTVVPTLFSVFYTPQGIAWYNMSHFKAELLRLQDAQQLFRKFVKNADSRACPKRLGFRQFSKRQGSLNLHF